MERARVVFGHLHRPGAEVTSQPTASAAKDDDVVIVAALRTPICKARRGGFKDTLPDDLLSTVFTALLSQTGLDPTLVDDIAVGNVNQPGAGATVGRIAQFFSNIPETTSLYSVNRFCSSGLQACADIAASIIAGNIDIGIGAGVESLTINPMGGMPPGFVLNPRVMDFNKARDTLIPMGMTSENVAERFGVTRRMQDHMAFESNRKAAQAQKNGWFKDEIVPVRTVLKDKEGNEKHVVIEADDGVRPGTTMEGLAKLKPVFKEDGTTTAGNSSQVSDGAAGVILARRSAARKYGLPVLGVWRSFAVTGVPPDVMGIGPAYAIPKALKKAGLGVDDIDIFEINEAFASQATYSVNKLNIPMVKVNPKGGAIALGHPLGCTGARQVATLLHEMKRRNKPGYGVVSMCIGTGMGAAAVIEYPGN